MILIYGANKSGEVAYRYLCKKNINILGFIDKNFDQMKEIDGVVLPVYSSMNKVPDEILSKCEKVLIAVGNPQVANQIKEELSPYNNIAITTIYSDFEENIIGKLADKQGAEQLLKLCLEIFGVKSFTIIDKNNITLKRTTDENLKFLLESQFHADCHEVVSFILNGKSENVAFDIGANRGYVASALSQKYIKVYCFEPSKKNLEMLRETIQLNNLSNVVEEEVALFSEDGEMEFFEFESHGHHSLGNTQLTPITKVTKVKTMQLDTYCSIHNISQIDLLKVDVEGFELEVFTGASDLMKNQKIKKIIFEVNPLVSKNLGRQHDEAFKFLIDNGFLIYTLDGIQLNEIPHSNGILDLLAIHGSEV